MSPNLRQTFDQSWLVNNDSNISAQGGTLPSIRIEIYNNHSQLQSSFSPTSKHRNYRGGLKASPCKSVMKNNRENDDLIQDKAIVVLDKNDERKIKNALVQEEFGYYHKNLFISPKTPIKIHDRNLGYTQGHIINRTLQVSRQN